MNGILGIRRTLPQTDQPRMNEFAKRWKQRFRAQNPTIQKPELNAGALVAYDTAWALAYAIDRLLRQGSFDGGFSATSSSTKILNFKIFDGGEDLLNQILETCFLGLSGPVRISRERDETLECSYDIINVIGNSYKAVGSWTEKGLNISSKHLVHWGGGSRKKPRGWVKPAPGQKLKIAVPWLQGFTQFILVKEDHANAGAQNQIYEITGLSIDVFKSVVKRLDYKLPYELIVDK
ncbi:hypothetical protein SUGI_0857750 [Cryptomeria japonica]|nr:hypothetical protein SUGI_0857750 [Cryptomeria japonica]